MNNNQPLVNTFQACPGLSMLFLGISWIAVDFCNVLPSRYPVKIKEKIPWGKTA